jgi:hypothetical protein
MRLRYYWKLIRRKTKALNPARLSLRNIWAVIQSWWRRKKELAGFELPKHTYEQIIWRRIEVIKKSPKCWESGDCIQCGCEMIGKTIEDRGCEYGCYPHLMNKQNWEVFKRINEIKLFK